MSAIEVRERVSWCEPLGLSAWGVIDERAVAEAARKALLAAHPDKGLVAEDAGRRIREILRAKEAGKKHVKLALAMAERDALSYEPMDWEAPKRA